MIIFHFQTVLKLSDKVRRAKFTPLKGHSSRSLLCARAGVWLAIYYYRIGGGRKQIEFGVYVLFISFNS